MPKRRKAAEAVNRTADADETTLAGSRFQFVLQQIFDGLQSRMAEAIECSQPMISRIVTGKQAPGPHVMAKLASLNELNPNWVYTGEGVPFRGTERSCEGRTASYILPVVRHPLMDSPVRADLIGSGGMYPVAAESYAPTRYWLEVVENDDLTPQKREYLGLRPHDLLLIETNPAVLGMMQHALRRLCVVATSQDVLRLAQVGNGTANNTPGIDGLAADYLTEPQSAAEKLTKERRGGKLPAKPAAAAVANLVENITADRIRGIVVLLVRRTVGP